MRCALPGALPPHPRCLWCGAQVECAPPTNVTLDVDQFRATEGGYIRLALESVAGSGSITAIELRQSPVVREADGVLKMSGSSFKSMQNTYGARWELSGFPDPPLDVRITGDNGRTLIARRAIVQVGAWQQSNTDSADA